MIPPAALGLAGEDLVGVRPEDLEISAVQTPGSVAATVELVELTGAETWVTLSAGGERVVGRAPADFTLEPSSPAFIRAERHLRFDDEGRTIL